MPATEKRRITAEDLYQFELIKGNRLSPDGAQVVYSLHRVDAKTEKKYSNLWVVPIQGGQPHQFTYGDQNDSSPQWSPDGTQIAFLSNRGDKEKPSQIYLMPFFGGEARPLTQIQGEIGALSWSPDGNQILCTVRKLDAEVLDREKDEQKKKLGVVVREYDRLFYKLDGYGYLPHERTHLWKVDAANGEGKQLTDSPIYDENDPAWSPDGKWIAFTSNRTPEPDADPEEVGVWIMPAAGGEFRKLPTTAGEKNLPSFSPDGKWIAFYGMDGKDAGWKNTNLWVVPTDGSTPACNLTAPFDYHVSPWTINDMGEPEQMPPTWSTDSRSIFFQIAYHGSSVLKKIDVDGKHLQEIIGEGGVVSSLILTATRNAWFTSTAV